MWEAVTAKLIIFLTVLHFATFTKCNVDSNALHHECLGPSKNLSCLNTKHHDARTTDGAKLEGKYCFAAVLKPFAQ